jgi:hypothetical protein
MTPLTSLWLPILLSAVFVFIASSIIHMALPWHKWDYRVVPNEDAFRNAVGPLSVPPGDYMVPRAQSMADMKSPEFQEKLSKGPVLMMTVFPNGMMSMGRSLGLWFLYSIVISTFAASIAACVLGPGASSRAVFHLAGSTAFLGYAGALWQMWIWYRRNLGTTLRSTIDSLIYAAITAGTLGWLWPK